jgi:oxygen-dependent protoporphyrinogen oxidase
MGISAQPELQRIIPWPESMPQYTVGHLQKVKIIEKMLGDFPGLHVTGNAYNGVGIPDCVRMAKEVAQRVTAAQEKFAR